MKHRLYTNRTLSLEPSWNIMIKFFEHNEKLAAFANVFID